MADEVRTLTQEAADAFVKEYGKSGETFDSDTWCAWLGVWVTAWRRATLESLTQCHTACIAVRDDCDGRTTSYVSGAARCAAAIAAIMERTTARLVRGRG